MFFTKTQGMLFAPAVNSLILKIQDIGIVWNFSKLVSLMKLLQISEIGTA